MNKKYNYKARYIAAIILILFLLGGLYDNYTEFFINDGLSVGDAKSSAILYTALSGAVNFALVSVIPLVIKIINRENYYRKSILIYFLNDIIILGLYILLFNYIKDYYHFGLLGLLLNSVSAYAFFVDPKERDYYLNGYDCKTKLVNKTSNKVKDKSRDDSYSEKYDSLIKLKELYDKEILTKEEFEEEKKKILK